MSTNDSGAKPPTPPAFSSAEELQEEHLKLSEEHERLLESSGEFLSAQIGSFIDRGIETGVLLENARERRSAQSLIDYWASVLMDKNGGTLKAATLRRFNQDEADKRAPDLK